jgi:hypothetical protein
MFTIIFARENIVIQYATNSSCLPFIIRYHSDLKAYFPHGLRRHLSSLVLSIFISSHAKLTINLLSKLVTRAQEF